MPCDTPQISVLMGVYDRSCDIAPLERSVRSILAQTISDIELLICDSGSSSEACRFLDALAEQDSRLHLVRDDTMPTDLAHKLNACLRHVKGKLVARMDDDDFSHPNRFKQQAEYLSTHPNVAFVGCNVNLCLQGKQVNVRSFPEHPTVQDFYFVQPFIHPTLMFRKEALDRAGGYSEDKKCILCEDYDLLLRLYTAGYQGANIQDVLFDYTISGTARGSRRMCHRWNETVTRWRRFGELGLLPKAMPYVLKPLAVGLLPEHVLRKLKQKQQGVMPKERNYERY